MDRTGHGPIPTGLHQPSFLYFFAAGQIKNKPANRFNAPVIDRSTKRFWSRPTKFHVPQIACDDTNTLRCQINVPPPCFFPTPRTFPVGTKTSKRYLKFVFKDILKTSKFCLKCPSWQRFMKASFRRLLKDVFLKDAF